MSSPNVNQAQMQSSNQQIAMASPPPPQEQDIAQGSMLEEVATNRQGNANEREKRLRPRVTSRDNIDDDDDDERPRQRRVNYRSPDLCCCDLQSGLVSMAVVDILIGFIFFVVALSRYIGPIRSERREGVYYYHRRPVIYHRTHFYHHRRPVWRFRRAVENITTTTTTLATTTASEDSRAGNEFFLIAFMAAFLIVVFSVSLLCAALMRKRTLCWVSFLISSLIFVGCSVLYCIYVFGNEDAESVWPVLAGLVLALAYRLYEGFVVYYFIQEPDPPLVRYAPRDVVYDSSPAIIYEPGYVGGYGYRPYYGGYGYGGYGYGAGLGVTTGLGLGLALGGGFHDHYDYCDGGFGYDCY